MILALEAICLRDIGSEMSAVMMGMLTCEGLAHFKASVSLDGFLPAKAKVLSGEFGVLRNLSISRTTYFPVKPDAPKMMMS